jgi:hypothetical protein
MLVFMSDCRATIDTDAPGANDAATISRLSAWGHDLCRRLTRGLVSIAEVVDTSHHIIDLKVESIPQIEERRCQLRLMPPIGHRSA